MSDDLEKLGREARRLARRAIEIYKLKNGSSGLALEAAAGTAVDEDLQRNNRTITGDGREMLIAIVAGAADDLLAAEELDDD